MTVAQIMQAIGCTEEQAMVLASHVATAPKIEQGAWVTTERTIKHCATCGKRQWHDSEQCIVCEA
jgi:hypothetical protein